jgi:hypothetical protein
VKIKAGAKIEVIWDGREKFIGKVVKIDRENGLLLIKRDDGKTGLGEGGAWFVAPKYRKTAIKILEVK